MLPKNKKLTSFSQELRKNSTKQEKHLWYDYLKTYPVQFNRQKVIGPYIADFYCDKAKLVIEIDGDQHGEDEALEYDNKRTAFLKSLGLNVIRFTNIEISKAFNKVCMEIDIKVKEMYPISVDYKDIIPKWEA